MSVDKEQFKDIIEYYDRTRLDYRISWDNSETPAVHFGFYEDNVSKHADALMNTNRVLADKSNIQAGEKVLDAGCGRGGSCFWLARNRQATVTGITPVQTQIEECIDRAKKLNLEKETDFVLADYCNMPFEDNSFDVVWACESLCHAGQKIEFYKEAFRVLKKGGRLVIAEYLRSQRPAKPEDEKLLAAWLNRWAIKDIDTKAEHQSYAESVGFKNIVIKDVTKNTQVSLRNLHNNSKKWLWVSKVLQAIRIRSSVQHDNQYASIKQYEALQKGIWFYSIITAQK